MTLDAGLALTHQTCVGLYINVINFKFYLFFKFLLLKKNTSYHFWCNLVSQSQKKETSRQYVDMTRAQASNDTKCYHCDKNRGYEETHIKGH